MIVRPMGECTMTGTIDPGSQLSGVRTLPNPFNGATVIEVQSTVTGPFRLELFDLLGNRVYAKALNLFEGTNQIRFDAGQLPSGTYVYTIGNTAGKSVQRMVKN